MNTTQPTAGRAISASVARLVASSAARLKVRGASGLALPALTAAVLLLSMHPAAAAGAGGTTTIDQFLQNLVNILTGTTGQIVAVLAVALCGIGAMFGALSARAFGGVVLGTAILFSAAWVVTQITT